MEQANLEWVIVDGVPRHVSDFSSVLPKQRPRTLCPQCAGHLTLKLGDIRRHHAVHGAGQICAAAEPETALHINTKYAIAATLSAAAGRDARLSVLRRCACAAGSAAACEQTLVREWLRGWTKVLIEHGVADRRRPDILLIRNGVAVGAIELLVSHAVSPDRSQALAELGVQWIEVRADEQLATPGGWTTSAPLAVLHAGDERDWRCDVHRVLHSETLEPLEALERKRLTERDAARPSAVLLAARVIDMYHAGEAHERFIYRVRELTTDGRAHTMQLQRGGLELATAELSASSDRREAWARLRPALDADIERLMRDKQSFFDSPMRWAQGEAAESIGDEALTDQVGNGAKPLATRFPRRWLYNAETDRWFLPVDMHDVQWDRMPDDR